jgi:hypothetical protein
MPSERETPSLLRPRYLILLGVALVIMFAINPDMRRRLFSGRRGRPPARAPGAARVESAASSLPASSGRDYVRDIETLTSAFSSGELPTPDIEIVRSDVFKVETLDTTPTRLRSVRYSVMPHSDAHGIDADSLRQQIKLHPGPGVSADMKNVVVTGPANDRLFTVTISRLSGSGPLGLSVGGQPPVYYDLRIRDFWPVPVTSIVYSHNPSVSGTNPGANGWIARVGRIVLKPGDVIGPSSALCGFKVLSVSSRCVWFQAFYDDEPEDGLPPIRWPDLVGIRMTLDGSKPDRVELRAGAADDNSRFLWVDDALRFRRTGARIIVDRLWGNAVRFRYARGEDGEDTLDILCVIVN